jgi:hypothetical protein
LNPSSKLLKELLHQFTMYGVLEHKTSETFKRLSAKFVKPTHKTLNELIN